jgi:hypothetical protein
VNPFDFFLEPGAESFPFEYEPVLAADLESFRRRDTPGSRLRAFLQSIDRSPRRTIDFLVDLNRRLAAEVAYVIRMEPGVQAPEETLELRRGSCRDSAWLLVQVLRHLGLAARFVSGYLVQLVADVKPLDGPAGPPADFTDLHAWAEVYLPGGGWIGLDATSGLLAGEGHIPLACTPEPAGAAPISGLVERCETEFSFSMSVERLHEDPRVTKPYTDAAWAGIVDLGRRVDAALAASDVRLSMGGEPTFVSIDDPDGAEWNVAAVGPTKRRLAGQLVRRLQARFAPGGLLHFGFGKWYPGEPCRAGRSAAGGAATASRSGPSRRWWLTTTGTTPSETPTPSASSRRSRSAWPSTAASPCPATRTPGTICGASVGCRPTSTRSTRASTTRTSARASPASSRPGSSAWSAGPCRSPRPTAAAGGPASGSSVPARMYLVPGDSPMGFRLPLDSLPWLAPGARESIVERDPFDACPPCPHTRASRASPAAAPSGAAASSSSRGVPPTSSAPPSCVEPRDGRLTVFLPPLARAEQYLDLVAAVESTARALAIPVQVEGYAPPADPRLRKLEVTPDPAVIEVNVHPAESWDDVVGRDDRPLRGGAPVPARHREVHARRPPRRHRRRKPRDGRRADAGRQPVFAAPRPAPSLVAYWHKPSRALVPVLGAVHRTDEPGAARRRGARRRALRARDRVRAGAGARGVPAVARRPRLPESPRRRDGEHAPRGVLRRQAVLARHAARPPRARRAARVRDAAATRA